MKRILFTFFLFACFLRVTPVTADALPLFVSVDTGKVTVQLNGLTSSPGYTYTLVSNPALPPVSAPESYTKSPTPNPRRSGAYVSWTISNVPNGTYFLYVKKNDTLLGNTPGIGSSIVSTIAIAQVGPATGTTDFFDWPLKVTPNKTAVQITGKIHTDVYPIANHPYIYLEKADAADIFASNPDAHTPIHPFYDASIKPDGSYSFSIDSLKPHTKYFIRQIIKPSKDSDVILSVKTDKFDSSTGYIPVGSTLEQSEFESRSYRLLAPWPGLSVLMDPSLCAEQQAAGTLPKGAICSINDLLNFIFKLLVGITAVALVIRIIIIGYEYITTDSPLAKASTKKGLFSAVSGLLLALSAYLILNTINPKLVTNDININGIGVSVFDLEGPSVAFSPKELVDNKCPTPPTTEGYLSDPKIVNKICTYLNGNQKFKGVKGVVIHGTGSGVGADSVIGFWVKNKKAGGEAHSAQFIINRDGTIVQVTGLSSTANHCGLCSGQGKANTSSVGIEMDMVCRGAACNRRAVAGWDAPTEAQKQSAAYLVNLLIQKYALDKDRDITTHGKEAANRTLNEGEATLAAIRPLLR